MPGPIPLLAGVPTPARYPIRHYPDITHTRQCQFPVPDWDVAFAVTEARECINPRPEDQAAIFRATQPDTVGFITYSEGCNDDVNKAVWSALGWDPDRPVLVIILATPGLDVLFIGPSDLSFSLGLRGEQDHPKLQEAIARIVAAARRHGKVLGRPALTRQELGRYRRQGFQFFMTRTDLELVATGARDLLGPRFTDPAGPQTVAG